MKFLLILPALLAYGADLEISRPARPWEFLDVTGRKAALFGHEDGTLEAWIYPLKIVRDLRLRFAIEQRVIPAEAIARRIISRPGSYTIVYTADDFQVRETLVAPVDEPGVLILLETHSWQPLRIDLEFTRDFQLMWPASTGSGYGEWNAQAKSFFFGADGKPFAAVLGSPDAELAARDYATNYSGVAADVLSLGSVNGSARRIIGIAGSIRSRADALAAYRRLITDPRRVIDETERYYREYLARTVSLELPDKELQRAWDWSRVSMAKGIVDNPLLGEGLVAGYGPSKGAYRPGFAWFFGRDSFWTSLALTSSGDLDAARTAIRFIAKYQRDDGKMPHEISQAASLVPWFQDFPYGYASADATPLFIIAVRDLVDAGGGLDFAREMRPRLDKAMAFMRSTLGPAGFPKNAGVGHGWVEGGPLLPVEVELYQAGCYLEAVRSQAELKRLMGEDASSLESEFQAKRKSLNDVFWIPPSRVFAFALGTDGKPVNEPGVLATVPMWFGLLDQDKAGAMIETLAEEKHASDWGMRIIGANSSLYNPAGYHFGSVWPLFTGWAAVGEYRSHHAAAALANLRANAWLALDGAGGNTTEVLSGETYSPLSTSSPHQIWSAAMVVSPIARGLLGLHVDAARRRVFLEPHLPADWGDVGIRNVPFAAGTVDLALRRTDQKMELRVTNRGAGAFELEFAPAYPLSAKITGPSFVEERNTADWHPRFKIPVSEAGGTLVIEHQGMFGYTVTGPPPVLAQPSANLKVISERWPAGRLELVVSGRTSRQYQINLFPGNRPLPISMPDGDPAAYVTQNVSVELK